jgi:hypothetical protein
MEQGCTGSAGTSVEVQVARLLAKLRSGDHREVVVDLV